MFSFILTKIDLDTYVGVFNARLLSEKHLKYLGDMSIVAQSSLSI